MSSPTPIPAATDLPASVLADRILRRAGQLGLTKKDLARKASISRQTLDSLLLAGPGSHRMVPSIQTLMRLSVALRLHPFWLTDAVFAEAHLAAGLRKRMQGDRAGFVRDSSCPDGCVVAPGARFQKVWSAQFLGNLGTQARKLICWDDHIELSATRPDGSTYCALKLRPEVSEIDTRGRDFPPGSVVDAAVTFVAPQTPGLAFSYWVVAEADGTPSFHESAGIWVLVTVEPAEQLRSPFPEPVSHRLRTQDGISLG